MLRIRSMVTAIACLLFGFAGITVARAEKRIALVIGNSAYANTTVLANPVNDAADMVGALKATGFEVVQALNADKRALDQAVRTFTDKVAAADVALFYYAGHGLQVGLQNFLVPVDAKLERERDLEFEAVKLEFVLRQMEIDREGKTSIVILDACRDNPLARNLARSMGTRSTAIGRGLAAAATGLGTFIAYSTQPGNVALDGDGRNSPFTAALVKHMPIKGRNLPATMIEVRKDVVAATGGRQVPWDHSALTGEFYFQPGAGLATSARQSSPGSSADVAALQERLRKLEDDAKKREIASDPKRAANPQGLPIPPVLPKAGREATKLTLDEDVRLDGNVLAETRQPNVDACRAYCDNTPGCIGFQHGKKLPQMGRCQLFDGIDQRQEDAGWRSGVVAGGPVSPTSGTVLLVPPELLGVKPERREHGFDIYEGWMFQGETIKSAFAESSAACAVVCRNTPDCRWANYYPESQLRQRCVALKVIAGARKAGFRPTNEPNAVAILKSN